MLSLASLRLLSVFLIYALADPAPGRIPKVYNALITSNQNLEPSKAYPVYQPVLHDTFAFPFQPTFLYGGDLLGNGILPHSALPPKENQAPKEALPSTTPDSTNELPEISTEASTKSEEPKKPEGDSNDPKSSPPVPPPTESPILLNAFGLPPQVLPLGHIDPVYNALPQFNPFTYPYHGLRFYDPYDPFGFSIPTIYRPFPNILGLRGPAVGALPGDNKKSVPALSETTDQTPTPGPDLNILNYSSKDPAIPNVPPPPLPQGGLKSDKSE